MNKTLLITATALLLLGSNTISSEPPKKEIKIPIVNHKMERLEIKARCYLNETSKSKADWDAFVISMSKDEKSRAEALVSE